MPLPNYSRVRLLNNNYKKDGVSEGAIGYIIEVYGDEDYEVEFSDREGITIAQIVVQQDEVELNERSNISPRDD